MDSANGERKEEVADVDRALNQPKIEDTIDLEGTDTYATVEGRYFKRLYFKGPPQEGGSDDSPTLDQLVLVHTNRICLVSLAPSHPVVAGKRTIRKLDFEGKSKYLDVKGSSKSKKQCSVVDEKTVLAWIECEPDGQRSVNI